MQKEMSIFLNKLRFLENSVVTRQKERNIQAPLLPSPPENHVRIQPLILQTCDLAMMDYTIEKYLYNLFELYNKMPGHLPLCWNDVISLIDLKKNSSAQCRNFTSLLIEVF